MRHLTKTTFLAALGAVLFAAAMPACSLAAAAAPSPKSAAASPVEQALDTKIDLDIKYKPLGQAILSLNPACPALKLTIDPELTREGAQILQDPKYFTLRQVTVRAALRLMLGYYLACKVTSSGVLVMTREKYLKDVSTVSYPVKDLLGQFSVRTKAFLKDACGKAQASTADYSAMELLPFVTSYVEGAGDCFAAPMKKKWFEAADYTRDTIILSQTPRGHELIAESLRLLREAANARAGTAVAVAEPEGVAETHRLLEEPIDLDFEKAGLDDILEYLCAVRPGLNIVIDPVLATGGIDLSTRVIDLRVVHVPLVNVLGLMLGQDLTYRVEPGYVRIVTRDQLLCDNPPVVAYPLSDILLAILKCRQQGPSAESNERPAPDQAFRDAMEEFKNAYLPVVNGCDYLGLRWPDENGEASCNFLAGILVVRQMPRGHERTAVFLNLLRQAFALRDAGLGGGEPIQSPAVGEPVPPAMIETLKRLGGQIEVRLENTSLDKELGFLVEAEKGLNIVVDGEIEASGIDRSERKVSLSGRMTVESALANMLGDDLDYVPLAGYVLVTTRLKAHVRLPLALYPVADIIDAAMKKHAPAVFRKSLGQAGEELRAQVYAEAANQLIELLKSEVNIQADPRVAAWKFKNDWKPEDECKRIVHLAGVLVVMQTPRGHERVAEFLTQLRREQQAKQK